ncbi:DNA polymerase III subunit delta' C-terminal domain-containing protein [Balneolaceae bacterium ANBcel3]|nr:DNA polymerase III subunit delta' C-terminal domain-containing protein [Balneolaceae bacterium ANBcel3]
MAEEHQTHTDSIIGFRRLVGQKRLRNHIYQLVQTQRYGHAYLISGQAGTGKTALALAFAEAINGVDHLGIPKEWATSHRRSWYFHPDIHVFMPLPSNVSIDELKARLELLSNDPYEIVDFSLRPSLTEQSSIKNRRAFYSVEFFNQHIRKVASLKPNEGKRTVIIISDVDKMRSEVSNAFLKLLEEPADRVMFILTTDHVNTVLPTILSRCQILSAQPLDAHEISEGLQTYDQINKENAEFLSKIAHGNYSFTRFFEPESLQDQREEIIDFLRMSYSVDVGKILETAQKWHSDHNKESQLTILDMIESFLRDIALFSAGADASLMINNDRMEVIQNFCSHLKYARIEEMLQTVEEARGLLKQNIQTKLVFTVMANRFSFLMRGKPPVVPSDKAWMHMPAFS